MSIALNMTQPGSNVIPIRDPAASAAPAVRRRPKITYVQLARPAAPRRRSCGRRVLIHVGKLSECVAASVLAQAALLALKAHGVLP